MAAPTCLGSGTVAVALNAGGAITPGNPDGVQADDVLLLLIANESVLTAGQLTNIASAGYTQLAGSPVYSGAHSNSTRFYGFWKRSNGSSPAVPSFSNPAADYIIAAIVGFRGCPTSGDPWDLFAFASDSNNDNAINATGITTTVPDTCVAYAVMVNNVGFGGPTTLAGTNLAGLTSRFYQLANSLSRDATFQCSTGTLATPGATGTATGTIGQGLSNDTWLVMALKPAAPPPSHIFAGEIPAKDFKVGNTQVTSVYAGTVKRWPS